MMQMNLQSRNRLTDLENELTVAMGEGIVGYFGKDVYTLLYLKWINSKDLLYSTWTSVMWQPGWERSLGKDGYMYKYGCMYIYVYIQFHCKWAVLQYKIKNI